MTPGPILVYQCPDTAKPLFVASIGSGNTFGATFWTDGHMDAPMLPERPPILISPHSGRLFWIDDLRFIEAVDWFRRKRNARAEYPEGRYAQKLPHMDQVLDYLESKPSLTRQREETIRFYAWRRSNDPARSKPPGEPIRHARSVANMERLVAILAPLRHPDRLLARAELLRQLGRFEECLGVLGQLRSPRKSQARDRIMSLAAHRDTRVAKVWL